MYCLYDNFPSALSILERNILNIYSTRFSDHVISSSGGANAAAGAAGWNPPGWGGGAWQQWGGYGTWPAGGAVPHPNSLLPSPALAKNGPDHITAQYSTYPAAAPGYDFQNNTTPRGDNFAQPGGKGFCILFLN